jgi:hypothetical protein
VNAAEWATLVAAAVTTAAVLFTGLKWLVKHWLSELKPNGGSSIKDQVTRLEARVDEIYLHLMEK